MYGVLGEDKSDAQTLKVIIRRLAKDNSLSIRPYGFNGATEMLKDGGKTLKLLATLRCSRFVICYDADSSSEQERREAVINRIIRPSGIKGNFCILVPREEIEAWILADLNAVGKINAAAKALKPFDRPENVEGPKERLEKLCRDKQRPLYSHRTHNPVVAEHLDLEEVAKKCPSFAPLQHFVTTGKGNFSLPTK